VRITLIVDNDSLGVSTQQTTQSHGSGRSLNLNQFVTASHGTLPEGVLAFGGRRDSTFCRSEQTLADGASPGSEDGGELDNQGGEGARNNRAKGTRPEEDAQRVVKSRK
jgi:hypothetical protein